MSSRRVLGSAADRGRRMVRDRRREAVEVRTSVAPAAERRAEAPRRAQEGRPHIGPGRLSALTL